MFQSYRNTEKEDTLINRETNANVNFREIKNTKTDNPPLNKSSRFKILRREVLDEA